jgi:tetratricopeptide (TPR) repeat protein
MKEQTIHDQVRDVLRHLDDPVRLAKNVLASRWISAGTNVRQLVERATQNLPKRLRSIIVRCDIEGELHRVVASDLGISQRYFYRQRREALERLGQALAVANAPATTHASEANPLGVKLGYATALQNAGCFDAAIAALEKLEVEIEGEARVGVVCRLADLCCDCGHLSRAREHIDRVEAIIRESAARGDDIDFLDTQLEVVKAKFAWLTGDLVAARIIAKRVENRLHIIAATELTSHVVESLASALLILVDLDSETGAFGTALSEALEAREIVDRPTISNPALRLRCKVAVADVRAYMSGQLAHALDDLAVAYEFGRAHGLVGETLRIAGMFCGLYLLRGEAERGLSFGAVALPIARSACKVKDFTGICLEVAMAHVARLDARSARLVLDEAMSACALSSDNYSAANAQLLEADIYLIEHRYDRALAAARASGDIFERYYSDRFLGSALITQAEAHDCLGDRRSALAAIDAALACLKPSGHAFTLARAYRCSARLTGKRAHILAEQDLTRMLRA